MTSITARDIPELSESFWAYLAGYIDGEGSILIVQNGVRMCITNTHLDTLEYFQSSMGFGTIHELNAKALKKVRTKICYTYNIGANGARAILPKLIPFLREKKEQSLAVLEYLATMSTTPGDNKLPHIIIAREAAKQRYVNAVNARKGNESER